MTTTLKKKIIVCISGNGSNLQALIDSAASGHLPCQIDLVVSNSSKAFGLQRAEKAGIPTYTQTLKSYKDAGKSRIDFDKDLAQKLLSFSPDLIILAGFMHILSPEFLDPFPNKVINLHPALPGAFDGIKAIERAFEAFQKKEIVETGVMVHKVIPQVDRGEVILVEKVPIYESDTLQALENRIHIVEHKLIVEATKKLLLE
jgi:formyltetrahydrofolate-dependent phosphoribosylglycinamide formyltransferase